MNRVVVGLCTFALILISALSPIDALGIDCDTIPPRAPFYLDSLATFQFPGGANCWGYIAPNGTEYAIIGTQTGAIRIVNVTTMTAVPGTVAAPTCSWRELKTYRHYCYAVTECTGTNEGMIIIDLQYLPDSMHFVKAYAPDPANKRSHEISIDTAKGFCYLVRQSYSGMRILSLADPENPVPVGPGITTTDLHDMTVFNDTVYAAEGSRGSFSIWNAANKASPQLITRVNIPSSGYVHNIWPTADRAVLATTEETAFKTVKIWNSQNLQSIQLISTYLGPSGLAHNAHIEDDYLYLSHYQSGISVLDLTVPECPVEVALFDTYDGNSPQFDGCWGVYPHTAGRQHVYASNIDGRFFILGTSAVSVDFSGTPRTGDAPLGVTFADQSPLVSTWKWYFGDGDSSAVENPSHSYDPGLYTVRLQIITPAGDTGIELKQNYVTALAETLFVNDTTGLAGTSMVWEIRHENNVPITEIKLPISLSNASLLTFDSISTVGCRTNYFEQKLLVFDNRPNGQAAIKLKADNGGGSPPLAPGSGPIAKVFYQINGNAPGGQQIVLSMPPMGISQHSLNAFTLTTNYVPKLIGGTTTTVASTCDCACHADPICDGQPDVLDVVQTVNVAFRGTSDTVDPNCPHSGRTDVDCSQSTDVIDVVLVVNVCFRGADAATTFCDPCL